jgi:3-deoxy-manno-octulosonate cytidylyltransferase (CMP-KDO synthetase)
MQESTNNRILAVIPARYASSRFPGKPLALIQGKPMVEHVWERCKQATSLDRIIIATDDLRIAQAVEDFGGEARMTSPDHPSGTDRIWEVACNLPEFGLIFNIQGDEPFLNPETLDMIARSMEEVPDIDIMTTVTPIRDAVERNNPNCVKAVISQNGRALYFSRAPIPYQRDGQTDQVVPLGYRHLGLYLYRREALECFTQLPPSTLESVEKLEQLRALEAGMIIGTVVVEHAPIGVDTPEDLAKVLSAT